VSRARPLLRGGDRVRGGVGAARREVVVVDSRDDLRAREVEEIGIARHIVRMLTETLAAVGVLAAQLALDQHAPGAVEHDDSLLQDLLETLTRFRHSSAPVESARERGSRSRAL